MMPTKQQSKPGSRNFFAIKDNFHDFNRLLSTPKHSQCQDVKSSNETFQHPVLTIFLNSYANAFDFNTP